MKKNIVIVLMITIILVAVASIISFIKTREIRTLFPLVSLAIAILSLKINFKILKF